MRFVFISQKSISLLKKWRIIAKAGVILHSYLPMTATSLERPLTSILKVAVVEDLNCVIFIRRDQLGNDRDNRYSTDNWQLDKILIDNWHLHPPSIHSFKLLSGMTWNFHINRKSQINWKKNQLIKCELNDVWRLMNVLSLVYQSYSIRTSWSSCLGSCSFVNRTFISVVL